MPIVSNAVCKEMFLRAGRHEVIPEIFMCAGYDGGGRDSCQVTFFMSVNLFCWEYRTEIHQTLLLLL